MTRDEILKILIDWNFWGNYKDNSLPRSGYTKKLHDFIATGEVVVIKGVRRCGKSTIVLQFARELIDSGIPPKDILIVNLEDPRFIKLDLNLLNQIYEIYLEEVLPDEKHYVILDEIQEIEGWEKFVRFLSEAKRINVMVTGSSSKLLSEEYSTLLSGRHIDLNIYPLSFKEFLSFNGIEIKSKIDFLKRIHEIRNLLRKYFEYGSFPKVALVQEPEKKLILENYFRDILIKDVQKRFNIREAGKMEEMAKYYLTNIASLHAYNKVKNVVRLSLDSVERFSYYFSLAGLIYFIPKFAFSVKTQILNPKKVYCVDTGLRNIISFRFSPDSGKLMENIVVTELKRRGYEIYYWKSKRQKEVDFVIKKDLEVKQLIQVCYSIDDEKTRKREISALIECAKQLDCSDLLIINEDYENEEIIHNHKIKFLPLWKWLLA